MKRKIWLIGGLAVLAVILGTVILIKPGSSEPAPQIGRLAPEFSLEDVNGQTIALKSVLAKNKVTIVNFWATWCPPCRAEIPELIEFVRKYRSEKVALLAVNIQEDPKTVKAFAENAGINFPILLDQSGKVAQDYRIYAIPTTFVIDGSGIIRDKIEGSLNLARLESMYREAAK